MEALETIIMGCWFFGGNMQGDLAETGAVTQILMRRRRFLPRFCGIIRCGTFQLSLRFSRHQRL